MGKPVFTPAALLGGGLGFLGVGLALITPENFPVSMAPYDVLLRAAGTATSGIGGVLIVGATLKWVGAILGDGVNHIINLSPIAERLTDFDNPYALQSDLPEICLLGNSAIGNNHATEDLLRIRYTKCPHIIRKLTLPKSAQSTIHGYYITYPLTNSGANRIDKKQIANGKYLQDRDLAASFGSARAIYISMIYGDSWKAKAAALLYLKDDIRHLQETNSRIRKFYAKPSTKDGLRLLKRYGFIPIDHDEGIWVLAV